MSASAGSRKAIPHHPSVKTLNISPTTSNINRSKEQLDTVESAKTASKSNRQVVDEIYGDYLAAEHTLTKNMSSKLTEVISIDDPIQPPKTRVVRLKKQIEDSVDHSSSQYVLQRIGADSAFSTETLSENDAMQQRLISISDP